MKMNIYKRDLNNNKLKSTCYYKYQIIYIYIWFNSVNLQFAPCLWSNAKSRQVTGRETKWDNVKKVYYFCAFTAFILLLNIFFGYGVVVIDEMHITYRIMLGRILENRDMVCCVKIWSSLFSDRHGIIWMVIFSYCEKLREILNMHFKDDPILDMHAKKYSFIYDVWSLCLGPQNLVPSVGSVFSHAVPSNTTIHKIPTRVFPTRVRVTHFAHTLLPPISRRHLSDQFNSGFNSHAPSQ